MIPIKVPPLGESITEATISRWLKQEGDAVAIGDTLVELETDKITVEVPALNAGILAKRLKAEGDVVHLAEVLAELDETGSAAAVAPAAAAAPAASAPAAPAPAAAPVPAAGSASAPAPAAPSDTRAAPSATRLAAESGTDLSQVAGTGRGGVVSKPDVIDHLEKRKPDPVPLDDPAAAPPPVPAGTTQPAAPASSPSASPVVKSVPKPAQGTRETREKMTTRRKRIAENLLQAQHSTAHLTTFNEIDMTAVSTFRERMKERVEKEHGVKLSFMPFFAKAACLALKAFPVVNSQLDGDSVIYKHYVNLGIAVATGRGLVVPNIRDAQELTLVELADAIRGLAETARAGKTSPSDMMGGTFSITNVGVFGVDAGTPILNPGEAGILALGAVRRQPWEHRGEIALRDVMTLALSFDHRLVDGEQGSRFLVEVGDVLREPGRAMLLR